MASAFVNLMRWLALTVAITPLVVHAQSPDAPAAKAAFADGERAFADDDYALALQSFEKAMRLAPRDAVRFNLAVCLERLGRFREAYSEYEAAARSAVLDDDAKARAREQANRTRERLGTVKFEASADSKAAVVFLGVERLGPMPVIALVDPKTHEFEVRTPDRTLLTTVAVGRGETKVVRLGLTSSSGGVVVDKPLIGPLTWVGAAVTAVGAAAFIGFGLNASALHDQYLARPTQDTRAAGVFARDFANVGLGVGIAGLVLVAADLLWHAKAPVTAGALELVVQ